MFKSIFAAFFLVMISKISFSQDSPDIHIPYALLNVNWKPVKVVEFFNDETTVYSDSCTQKNGYKALNGFWRVYPMFLDDSLFTFNIKRLTNTLQEYTIENKGKWFMKDNFLVVNLNPLSTQYELENENPLFFGNMNILQLNDTELVVEKLIDRLGKWKRTFYFRKE
jgi:hypothetical protein